MSVYEIELWLPISEGKWTLTKTYLKATSMKKLLTFISDVVEEDDKDSQVGRKIASIKCLGPLVNEGV